MKDHNKSLILKISKGHAAAMSILVKLENIDERYLDYLNYLCAIRGGNVWVLYKNVCERNIEYLMAVITGMYVNPNYTVTINGTQKRVIDCLNRTNEEYTQNRYLF